MPRFHFLRRLRQIIAALSVGNPDDLLCSKQVASAFGVSKQWVEIARHRGWGPPYVRLSPRRIRYRRADVIKWCHEQLRILEMQLRILEIQSWQPGKTLRQEPNQEPAKAGVMPLRGGGRV